MEKTPVLVVHGGAIYGEMDYDKTIDGEYRATLNQALDRGYGILSAGGSALDAVEATIHIMEDCGLFDAGRGAVFTSDGKNELDASIMDGKTRKAGAVAGVNKIKHPITAARKVMEETWHVTLIGSGAEEFAQQIGIETVDPKYFFNEKKWQQYLVLKEDEEKAKKHETVGCVALDSFGNLAAGTSTGGLEMKHWGRIGDSPIIGAGTYADNETCAISCTGEGEFFVRNVVAYDVTALMKYKGMSLDEATKEVLRKLEAIEGSGGLIAIDKDGNIAMPYTTEAMFRAYQKGDERRVQIYAE